MMSTTRRPSASRSSTVVPETGSVKAVKAPTAPAATTSETRLRAAAPIVEPAPLDARDASRALFGEHLLAALESLGRAQEKALQLECEGDRLEGWPDLAGTMADLRVALWSLSGDLCTISNRLAPTDGPGELLPSTLALAMALRGVQW